MNRYHGVYGDSAKKESSSFLRLPLFHLHTMAGVTTEELERFRRQWREEVDSRTKGQVSISNKVAILEQKSGGAGPSRVPPPPQIIQKAAHESHNDWVCGYHDLEDRDEARKLGEAGSGTLSSTRREPISALEHYEKAVERETEGSLGDSLNHYRKAYKVSGLFQNILMCYTD